MGNLLPVDVLNCQLLKEAAFSDGCLGLFELLFFPGELWFFQSSYQKFQRCFAWVKKNKRWQTGCRTCGDSYLFYLHEKDSFWLCSFAVGADKGSSLLPAVHGRVHYFYVTSIHRPFPMDHRPNMLKYPSVSCIFDLQEKTFSQWKRANEDTVIKVS